MKTQYFDVTDIVLYVEKETSVSGIQRVSFEVIKRMIDTHGTEQIKLSYWDRARRDYVSIPSDFIAEMPEFDPDTLSAVFFGKGARSKAETAPTLERYRNKPMKYRFHYLRSSVHAARGNEAHFAKHNTSIAEWRAFNAGDASGTDTKLTEIPRTRVEDIIKSGDRLVVLGATWAIDGIDECFEGLAKRGVEISQLIHDLIPIITPEHIAGDFSQEFYRWLTSAAGYCTSFFANSKNTAKDLQAFMDEVGVQKPIETVPLAQEFTISEPPHIRKTKGPDGPYKARVDRALGLRREILNLSKTPFVLVVGTMESRKNIWRLALAWQRMTQEEGIDVPKLVFAGKPGWYNDDFNQLNHFTGNLGGWIQFADRPTDGELAFLYETCVFTAMVSFYEGWGLPIGESLHFGKTAVVANNSSMPEVGADMVEYCDAQSLDSIHAACRRLIANPSHRQALEAKIAATRLRTWDDVTQDFVKLLST